jgi:tetratricopeptide (TPR) repeat protein
MTIPDPVLTREYQIPNACNRCHTDKSVDWSIEAVQKWYGPRMERPTRERARLLARLKQSDLTAVDGVLGLIPKEKNDAWRAVEARFLSNAIQYPQHQQAITDAMVKLTSDTSPLPQTAAIDVLAGLLDFPSPIAQSVTPKIRELTSSPIRSVRLKAIWALRREQPWYAPNASAALRDSHAELLEMLACNQDQPLGAFHWAQYYVDTGRAADAIPWFEKAIAWDPRSGAFRHAYAMALDTLGKPKDALLQAAKAAELEPEQAIHSYALGLLYAELGQMNEARTSLQIATTRDPRQPRYWYNLALAESQLQDVDAAINALRKAEDLDPSNADFPYVRGTILYRAGRRDEARNAAQAALKINPQHAEAARMLQELSATGS